MIASSRRAALPVLAATLIGIPASGQIIDPRIPTAAECQQMASEVRSGSRTNGVLGNASSLSECGEVGTSTIAWALSRATTESDTSYLEWLVGVGSGHRAATILSAAQRLAATKKATSVARVAALMILLAQYEPQLGLSPMGGLSTRMEMNRTGCRITWYAGEVADVGPPFSDSTLRPIASTLDSIFESSSTPPPVRIFAQCVRRAMFQDLPRVKASQVALVYVCGNKFTVKNSGRYGVHLTYTVASSKEAGFLNVEPESTYTLITGSRGAVSLVLDGRVVGVAGERGVKCE